MNKIRLSVATLEILAEGDPVDLDQNMWDAVHYLKLARRGQPVWSTDGILVNSRDLAEDAFAGLPFDIRVLKNDSEENCERFLAWFSGLRHDDSSFAEWCRVFAVVSRGIGIANYALQLMTLDSRWFHNRLIHEPIHLSSATEYLSETEWLPGETWR